VARTGHSVEVLSEFGPLTAPGLCSVRDFRCFCRRDKQDDPSKGLHKLDLPKTSMHCVNLSVTCIFNNLQVAGDCQTTTKYVEVENLAGDFAGEKIAAALHLRDRCGRYIVARLRATRSATLSRLIRDSSRSS
jgi:hypothetical protein